MSDIQNIQWFPGHMKKTERKIKEYLPLIDAVAEIIDARIPVSSRNPDLAGIIAGKPKLILMNKCDIADKKATDKWIEYYRSQGVIAIPVDCKSGKGTDNFIAAAKKLLTEKLAQNEAKGMVGKTLKIMVVGIPNVGKSSFINRMAKNAKAKVEDRPGVTRGNQWFKIDDKLEILDTPGVLWPKFDDMQVGERLAFTGAVKDNVVDIETLAFRLCEFLSQYYPSLIKERYGVDCEGYEPWDLVLAIGKKRGFLVRGGEVDTERTATVLLNEYRGGKLGNLTLEHPDFSEE